MKPLDYYRQVYPPWPQKFVYPLRGPGASTAAALDELLAEDGEALLAEDGEGLSTEGL